MADSIKKETEVNELMSEAQDMELGDESGASAATVITTISIAIGAATVGAQASNMASQKYNCGVTWSISAECRKSHKPC